jgi:translation elongation factor EF-G
VKNYLDLWDEAWRKQESLALPTAVSVIGEREKHFGSKSEFARIRLTAYPAEAFEVEDRVTKKDDLEKLNVGWPDCAIFGLLDELMLSEPAPLYKVRVVLEEAWYHEAGSSRSAFRQAGRDAGRKIMEAINHR